MADVEFHTREFPIGADLEIRHALFAYFPDGSARYKELVFSDSTPQEYIDQAVGEEFEAFRVAELRRWEDYLDATS